MISDQWRADLTPGKLRGLQQCATRRGVFSILGIDHRQNLRRSLRPEAPEEVSDATLTAFKRQVVGALGGFASAVLLDPEYGAVECIESGSLLGTTGLIVAQERTGYSGERTARVSELLPDWSPDQTRGIGASGCKVLVYYHPGAPTALAAESLVANVAAVCAEADIPLFLEILTYSIDGERRRLAGAAHQAAVLDAAERLTAIEGVDVLKAEFPVDIETETDERAWMDVCAEMTRVSHLPWVLLSAGVDFEVYLRQVAVAAQAGASGVAVGRAVWSEAVSLDAASRERFLMTIAAERMRRVTALCEALAHPWSA
ncbi:MAG: tagatose 1,6-diphosphate aldolase [Chloroflexi bacterium]|nr:tagatose 1,6-diphosphate aldolase [Chloroflexota bacterium]